MKDLFIGIDAGVNTGMALWDATNKEFASISSTMIHRAMDTVLTLHEQGKIAGVIVEDARFVRFKTNPLKAQGAGSIKRDAKVWEDFLKDHGIPHKMIRPNKSTTKFKAEKFLRWTRCTLKTNEHGRDAAMLVFKMVKL